MRNRWYLKAALLALVLAGSSLSPVMVSPAHACGYLPCPEPEPEPEPTKQNNGYGNGDQGAPGQSGLHNNAENAANRNPYPGNSNTNGNNDDPTPDVNTFP